MATANLTAERLRELLHYDPETGKFVWRHDRGRVVAGTVAGATSHGYVMLTIDRAKVLSHRAAWLYVHGTWPNGQIDHINGDRSDNRIGNLRDVTHSVNQQNARHPRRDNASGFLGVTRHKNQWTSQVTVNGQTVHLGLFKSPQEAALAYLEAKRKYHIGCTI